MADMTVQFTEAQMLTVVQAMLAAAEDAEGMAEDADETTAEQFNVAAAGIRDEAERLEAILSEWRLARAVANSSSRSTEAVRVITHLHRLEGDPRFAVEARRILDAVSNDYPAFLRFVDLVAGIRGDY